MKKNVLILIAAFLVLMGSSIGQAAAQQKEKSTTQSEEEILKAIDEQKKAMAEAKKAQQIVELELAKENEELQKRMKELDFELASDEMAGEDAIRIYTNRSRARTIAPNSGFIFTPGAEFYGFGHSGDGERTTWDFSRSVKENTFSRDYSFDVEKSVNTVVMSVNGDCKAGDIRIKIVMPNGKTYSDIVIDEFGNLNWRKSFLISETENQDKTGEWKFQISSNKATGFFKISLQTY
jgi:hypothetical protein